MPGIVVMALLVVGGIAYILTTLLAYSGESSRLSEFLHDIQKRLREKQQRLVEYEARLEEITGAIPALRSRCTRLERWIALLRMQLARVEAETSAPDKGGSDEKRQLAIQRGLRAAQRRWKGR